MTEPFQPAVPPDHAAHDPMWMAALAARDPDLPPSERTRAEEALEGCRACADVFADLVAVSAAIPSAALPARPREFTLTPADAARLRRRGLRGWLAGIGSARVSFRLAMGLTTLGIAGLLVATVPAIVPLGGATSSQVLSTVGNAVAPVPGAGGAAPAASAAARAPSEFDAMTAAPDTESAGDGEVFSGDDGDPAPGGGQGATDLTAEASTRDDLTGLSALAVVALLMLVAGLGLFALRWSARRSDHG